MPHLDSLGDKSTRFQTLKRSRFHATGTALSLTFDSNLIDSPPISPDEKVVLCFHEGACAVDTTHPSGVDVTTVPAFLDGSEISHAS